MSRRGYAETEFGQIHYREAGVSGGLPLLLLHQGRSSSAQWDVALPHFGKRLHVLAPDNPGNGMSDQSARDLSIGDYARWYISFLDALGIERAHFLGHHPGASIALELGAAYPDRVGKLVFWGLPAFDPADAAARGTLLPFTPGFADTSSTEPDYAIDADGRFLEYLVPNWVAPEQAGALDAQRTPEQFVWRLIAVLQAGPNYIERTAAFEYEAYERLGRQQGETLFLACDDHLLKLTRKAQPHAPGSRYAKLAGHDAHHLRDPAEFVQTVLDFLGA